MGGFAMEVKKYRYNDMTERYRRMNRFYIILLQQ